MTDDKILQVGFTGTRNGMNYLQKREVYAQLKALQSKSCGLIELSHGGCLGSDEQVHAIAQGLKIFCHVRPGSDPKMTMHLSGNRGYHVYPRKSYKVRNTTIVTSTSILIVAPYEECEQVRGGTWMTYRIGLRYKSEVRTIYPSGAVYCVGE